MRAAALALPLLALGAHSTNAEYEGAPPTDTASAIAEAAATREGATSTEQAIAAFYRGRQFRAYWFADGGLSERGRILLETLAASDTQGLRPEDYGMPELAERAATADRAAERARVDVALTRALVDYAGDAHSGRVSVSERPGGTHLVSTRPGPAEILLRLEAADDLQAFLTLWPPADRRYVGLRAALSRYRAVAAGGGWPTVELDGILQQGDSAPAVAAIRERLVASGDLETTSPAPRRFDARVARAVRRFQRRHGLTVDGIVGPETVRAMNVSAAERAAQITINLERRRWLASRLGERYVFVNIASGRLRYVEDADVHLRSRAIVGRHYLQTPVFSDQIDYVEFNPDWNVPRSIAVEEMLPRIKDDPGYLPRNNFQLLHARADPSSAVDPRSIDWSRITPANFPYFIRERPGPNNALGQIVFRFPNQYNIYIHDTPAQALFKRDQRFFSHGCIRIADPRQLAALLLRGRDGARVQDRIHRLIETRDTRRVTLPEPVPVHIIYMTAWIDEDGAIRFEPDVYGRDSAVRESIGL